MKQSDGKKKEEKKRKCRPSKVCTLSEETDNLALSVWQQAAGSSAVLKMLNSGGRRRKKKGKTSATTPPLRRSSPIWTKVGPNQDILAGADPAGEVWRQPPLNQVSCGFELSSLVFTSKDMKGGAESRTGGPPIPLP